MKHLSIQEGEERERGGGEGRVRMEEEDGRRWKRNIIRLRMECVWGGGREKREWSVWRGGRRRSVGGEGRMMANITVT